MGSIWVKEFVGGLDTRRLPETSSGGILVKANNGHLTRGGEFEQRAAFVPTYALPAGTTGLFYTPAGLVVFGSDAEPLLPTGVSYQRLQHSDTALSLVRVKSADLYKGKIYAVGEFSDGSVLHFYDGVRVEDWYDGRARATFRIVAGATITATAATGSFEITGGTLGGGNEVTDIKIDGVSIISAPVAHTGSNSGTATAVASAINSATTSPDYTASASGVTVAVSAAVTGTAANGKSIVRTVGGDVTTGNATNMGGGAVAGASTVASITVNGVSVMSAPVSWTGTAEGTAAAVAAEITSYASVPEYTATAVGDEVNLVATDAGPGPNGFAVVITAGAGTTVTPATTTLDSGGTFGGTTASGSFTIVSGAPGATLLPKIDGVALAAAPVAWVSSVTDTAAAVAAAITADTTVPDYTATSLAGVVTVTTATRTDAVNGKDITFDTTGTISLSTPGSTATGSFEIVAIGSGSSVVVKVAGVQLTSGPVYRKPSAALTATEIAAQINAHTSVPDYTATSAGPVVTIETVDETDSVNGQLPTLTFSGYMTATNITVMSGGADPVTTMVPMAGGKADDAFTPGDFVATIGSKVYSTSGPILHFSGVGEPTKWTTDNVGAGFIDMSSETSGSEDLVAVARYQNLAAIFAERLVQVWYVDPDPVQNKWQQTLNNTGTASPRSVTPFGDTDLFYLDESGLRSLRARDSSNAAATTDIGVPVDDTITAKLQTLEEEDRRQIIGLIEPVSGRFWLIMKDQVFVFSFFTGAKVSAWSTYDTTYFASGESVAFDVTEALVYNRRVYLRSGDTIFCYGGTGATLTYDETEAEAWLPYLDAQTPTKRKEFRSIDVAMRGNWTIAAAMQPTDETAEDSIATIDQTTYNAASVPFNNQATHVSLRFRSLGTGPHKLGSCVIQYEGNDDDD